MVCSANLPRTANVLCIGCPESRNDAARVEAFLRTNGWNIVDDFTEADLVIFRTCGLTEFSEKRSIEIIKALGNYKRREAHLVVCGCLPKINPEALKREFDGVMFGESESAILNEITNATIPIQGVQANHIMASVCCVGTGVRGFCNGILKRTEEMLEVISPDRSIFHIKVATGCLGKCSFCAARMSRGAIHSKGMEAVMSEFKRGLDRGYRRFALLGTDVGAYGRDRGHTLVNLLEEMTKENAKCLIGLRNINPRYLNEMFDELKPFFASGKIWFLGTAVESGSDRILGLMGRKYKVEDFRRCIQAMNRDYPGIILRTQIMVGFPTETRCDFEESLQLLVDMTFDWVEIYKFSKRPGTAASALDGQVSEETKDCRYRELEHLAESLMIKHSLRDFSRKAGKIGSTLVCSDLVLRTLLALSRWRAYRKSIGR